jgi:hypothetical protein
MMKINKTKMCKCKIYPTRLFFLIMNSILFISLLLITGCTHEIMPTAEPTDIPEITPQMTPDPTPDPTQIPTPIPTEVPTPGPYTEIIPDQNTVLLDHFNDSIGATYVNGTLAYIDSQNNLFKACDFKNGNYARYNFTGWYTWPSAYDPTGKEGTVELWVYPRKYENGLINLNWNNSSSPPSAGYILHFSINAEGKLSFGTWTAISGPALTGPQGNATIPLNQWTHVACSWGPAGTKLYVNGILDGSSPDNCYPALNSTTYLYLNYWGTDDLGYVDELHLSSVQRTDSEILSRVQ